MSTREKSAIELFEEATYLLRRAPGGAIAAYYTGSVPFVLGFLFFWADMSQSAFAYEQCAAASLGLALLFCWMVYWQAIFVQSLHAQLSRAPGSRWLSLEARRLGVLQVALQPTKFLVLPVAALTILPYAGVYAFYQHLMSVPCSGGSLSRATRAAKTQALVWPWQNWNALAILVLLNAVVFVNLGITILGAPYLLKSLLGIESAFTRGGSVAFNTTFLAVTAALTYLVTNPLAKAVYLLRSFYAESIETGEDLRAELKSGVAATTVVLAAILMLSGAARAQAPAPLKTAPAVSADQMNRTIDDVIHRPEFTWRLPRAERPPQNNPNWFVRATESFVNVTVRALQQVGRWVDRFARWLVDKLRGAISVGGPTLPAPNARQLRAVVYALLAAVALLLGWLLVQALRLKRSRPAARATAVVAPPVDLNSPRLLADERPLEEWLRLARDCQARQEYRLALRALYLAGLAYLAEQSLISIHRSKSNLDYSRELLRKARHQPQLLQTFADNVGVFERTWYGMYDVDLGTLERFEANLARMKAGADAP
ncbi:MAG TPA: DUF4129 domain-containing protein [Bryobacteraceae bacterium]|nr:DUF4129 domain-containing protein [Bryobacteraceae bacterium]